MSPSRKKQGPDFACLSACRVDPQGPSQEVLSSGLWLAGARGSPRGERREGEKQREGSADGHLSAQVASLQDPFCLSSILPSPLVPLGPSAVIVPLQPLVLH